MAAERAYFEEIKSAFDFLLAWPGIAVVVLK
jgi:hypothetical protein